MKTTETIEALEALQEHAAILAWMTGMQLDRERKCPMDAKEVGSVIAERIRKIKLDKFLKD